MLKVKLKQLCLDHNISLLALSKELKIEYSALRRFVNNNRFLKVDIINKICKRFNCSIGDLLEYKKV